MDGNFDAQNADQICFVGIQNDLVKAKFKNFTMYTKSESKIVKTINGCYITKDQNETFSALCPFGTASEFINQNDAETYIKTFGKTDARKSGDYFKESMGVATIEASFIQTDFNRFKGVFKL